MNKYLIMASMEVDEESMEISISDPQVIDHLPNAVFAFSKHYMEGRKYTEFGLPEVLYLGPNEIKVTGAFKYGELSFLEVEGDLEDIMSCDSFICIDAYHDEEIEDAEVKEVEQAE